MPSLSVGTRLGPYEIQAPLGAGGMGEVYRARDTKLGRDVALKILPEAFANDSERLARFRREAQVLASLNHQNIAAIYGLEDSSESSHALVMELVEGPTLADRIAQGPIPLDKALPIAKQIAEALDAAHELGVIHRDLKPANIKLRPDGTVKVLDFGLAKILDAADGNRQSADGIGATNSPTLSLASTRAGMILGTAADIPSRRVAASSTSAPMSGPSASCCTRCSPVARHSEGTMFRTFSRRSSSSNPTGRSSLQRRRRRSDDC